MAHDHLGLSSTAFLTPDTALPDVYQQRKTVSPNVPTKPKRLAYLKRFVALGLHILPLLPLPLKIFFELRSTERYVDYKVEGAGE